jgi:hypothetical protein
MAADPVEDGTGISWAKCGLAGRQRCKGSSAAAAVQCRVDRESRQTKASIRAEREVTGHSQACEGNCKTQGQQGPKQQQQQQQGIRSSSL